MASACLNLGSPRQEPGPGMTSPFRSETEHRAHLVSLMCCMGQCCCFFHALASSVLAHYCRISLCKSRVVILTLRGWRRSVTLPLWKSSGENASWVLFGVNVTLSTANAIDGERCGAPRGGSGKSCVADGDTWKLWDSMSHGCGGGPGSYCAQKQAKSDNARTFVFMVQTLQCLLQFSIHLCSCFLCACITGGKHSQFAMVTGKTQCCPGRREWCHFGLQ